MDDNTKIGHRIFKARKFLDMSRAELGKKVNLHESTIKRYEDGEIKSLDINKLRELAEALDIAPAALVGWEDDDLIAELQGPVLDHFDGDVKKALEFQKAVAEDVLNEQHQNVTQPQRFQYPGRRIRLPILGKVTAGPNGIAYLEPLGEEWVDAEDINSGAKFYWLEVRGDSMIGAGIMPGDLALVREQSEVDSGDLAVVIVNGEEGTLKKIYKKENSIVLQSANAAYPPRIFSGTELRDIKIVGKVKETKRKYR